LRKCTVLVIQTNTILTIKANRIVAIRFLLV